MAKPTDKLSGIQSWMQSMLIEPSKSKSDNLVEHYIAPASQLTARQSLAIYQRSYYRRLLECMKSQFKALHHTLGDELFEEFCLLFLKQFPSSSPSLADLGENFPLFLEESRPDKEAPERWIDFMIAMAQFEIDLYKVFDQLGSEGQSFADSTTPDADLKLQSCIHINEYPFEVHKYYHEVSEGKDPHITSEKRTSIAFVRTDYQVRYLSITDLQFAFLKRLLAGDNIEKALWGLQHEISPRTTNIDELWLSWKLEWIKMGFFLIK